MPSLLVVMLLPMFVFIGRMRILPENCCFPTDSQADQPTSAIENYPFNNLAG
jgi:hypothetical protein